MENNRINSCVSYLRLILHWISSYGNGQCHFLCHDHIEDRNSCRCSPSNL